MHLLTVHELGILKKGVLHCWNFEADDERTINLGIRKKELELKLTPYFLVVHSSLIIAGRLNLIVFEREDQELF